MLIKQLVVSPFQSNCFIVSCETSREAAIIDPGDDADKILDQIQSLHLDVKYILLTHAHIDHVSAAQAIFDKTQAAVCMHPDELPLYENIPMQASMFQIRSPKICKISRFLKDGETLALGEGSIQVISTPGHSPGGLTFCTQDKNGTHPQLFVGDTLFMGSIGRTDLWGGDYRQLIQSIKEKILCFDDPTPVHTGHGPSTTVGQEKKSNPFLT